MAKIGKTKDPLAELAMLQKVSFRVLAGMAFAFIFLCILSVSRLTFSQECFLYLGGIIALGAYLLLSQLKENHGLKRKFKLVDRLPTISTILVILVVLVICANLISGYYGSTNDDGAFHTFMIRVIIDNPTSLLTHSNQPYASYTTDYPNLAHSLAASAVVLFGVPIQDIVMMFCAIMPAMVSLAFFASMHVVFRNKKIAFIGAVLSGLFTLGHSWGPIGWNDLPLLMSFFISVNALGLIFYLFEKSKFDWLDALILSLVFIVAIETYYVSFLIITFWIIILLAMRVAKKQLFKQSYGNLTRFVNRKYLSIFGAFLIPATVLIPYIASIYNHGTPSSQNYASDISMQHFSSVNHVIINLIQQRTTFNWLFDISASARFFQKFGGILSLSSLSIILIPTLFIILCLTNNTSKKSILEAYALFFSLFLLLMAFLTWTTNTSIGNTVLSIVDPERLWQHIYICGVMLASAAVFLFGYSTYIAIKYLWTNKLVHHQSHRTMSLVTAFILSIIIFNIGITVSSSFIPEFEQGYNTITTNFNTYKSIGQNDVQMMYWIKDNLNLDSTILVSAGDSGQYVTAVTQIRTIYNFCNNIYSIKYENLISELSSNPFNSSVIQPMLDYNIFYVYVGSVYTNYPTDLNRVHFNASLIKETPYFTLTNQIGNCYLFKFDQTEAKVYLIGQNNFDK